MDCAKKKQRSNRFCRPWIKINHKIQKLDIINKEALMKKLFLVILIFIIVEFNLGFSNNIELNAFSGIGFSDFDNQPKTGLSIPVGFRIDYGLNKNFLVGIGIHTVAKSFQIDKENFTYILRNSQKVIASGESEFFQTIYFLNIKYIFEYSSLNPYITLSSGLFTGNGKLKGKYHYINDTYERSGTLSFDFKNSFVFSFGFGIILKEFDNSNLSLNTGYNIITVEPDLTQSEKEGGNNYYIAIEYSLGLTGY